MPVSTHLRSVPWHNDDMTRLRPDLLITSRTAIGLERPRWRHSSDIVLIVALNDRSWANANCEILSLLLLFRVGRRHLTRLTHRSQWQHVANIATLKQGTQPSFVLFRSGATVGRNDGAPSIS